MAHYDRANFVIGIFTMVWTLLVCILFIYMRMLLSARDKFRSLAQAMQYDIGHVTINDWIETYSGNSETKITPAECITLLSYRKVIDVRDPPADPDSNNESRRLFANQLAIKDKKKWYENNCEIIKTVLENKKQEREFSALSHRGRFNEFTNQ